MLLTFNQEISRKLTRSRQRIKRITAIVFLSAFEPSGMLPWRFLSFPKKYLK